MFKLRKKEIPKVREMINDLKNGRCIGCPPWAFRKKTIADCALCEKHFPYRKNKNWASCPCYHYTKKKLIDMLTKLIKYSEGT